MQGRALRIGDVVLGACLRRILAFGPPAIVMRTAAVAAAGAGSVVIAAGPPMAAPGFLVVVIVAIRIIALSIVEPGRRRLWFGIVLAGFLRLRTEFDRLGIGRLAEEVERV